MNESWPDSEFVERMIAETGSNERGCKSAKLFCQLVGRKYVQREQTLHAVWGSRPRAKSVCCHRWHPWIKAIGLCCIWTNVPTFWVYHNWYVYSIGVHPGEDFLSNEPIYLPTAVTGRFQQEFLLCIEGWYAGHFNGWPHFFATWTLFMKGKCLWADL